MYLRICRRLGAALPFSVSSPRSAPCNTSWKDRPRPGSFAKATRPLAKITSASSAWASGELVIALACLNSEAFNASHAAITADPFEAAVHDPPSTGEVGNDESPIFAVTASIGRPRASAPICARIVHVPVPMSDAAVDTSRWPSLVSFASAAAFIRNASHMPVAMPNPINSWPSFRARGNALRWSHPIDAAPSR